MKKIKAIGIKEIGKPFRTVNAKVFRHDIDELPKGKYQIIVEKYHKKATPLQFRYLYGVVYPLSMVALNDAGYEFANVDQVDMFWKSKFANIEILERETGEIMKIPQSKSEFVTIDEMAYCNAIRNYCSEYLSAYIPEPDPNYKDKK